jgi:hypothetical protein
VKREEDALTKRTKKSPDEGTTEPRPYRVRLPGFISAAASGEEIGLGDLITRVTHAAGIRPCGGCQRRAAVLNRRVVFGGSAAGRRV